MHASANYAFGEAKELAPHISHLLLAPTRLLVVYDITEGRPDGLAQLFAPDKWSCIVSSVCNDIPKKDVIVYCHGWRCWVLFLAVRGGSIDVNQRLAALPPGDILWL